ncbi:hypothetical protein EAE96_001163 [Botrytis aclada]|nr:hypothetical protein EAE96_001163 [Botrytis aclada]
MSKPLTIYEPFEGNTKEEWDAHVPNKRDFLLCHNCGWTVDHQYPNCYVSNIKCSCHGPRGFWAIGEKYVLKEREVLEMGEPSYFGADVATSKFVAENTTIPVVKFVHGWKDSKSHFSLAERVPGTTLFKAGMMTRAEMKVIAKEVVEYLIELRKFTSTRIEAVDGSKIRDRMLGSKFRCHSVTNDAEEWWGRAGRFCKDNVCGKVNITKEEYPVKGPPYVLTHGDLDASNIMVKDRHVCGIIDWETSGYLPEWWEAVAAERIQPLSWYILIQEEWRR